MMYSTVLYSLVVFYLIMMAPTLTFPMTIASVIAEQPGISIPRQVRILSTNSKGFLRITGSNVDALGLLEEESTKLQLETANIRGTVAVRIKSVGENKFLCVGTSDKLVVEEIGNTSDRCAFVQDMHAGYTTYQSVHNKAWYLGFKRLGKAKRPSLTAVGQSAARFLEYYN